MHNFNYIQDYIHISNNQIIINNNPVFTSDSDNFSKFSKEVYTTLQINYPKFFKMDNLSKLAFLGADILLKKHNLTHTNTALIFANKSSSLDTDLKHQQTIANRENYFPSPSVFVYTLPNICLGEIAIKFKLHTENSFFIFEKFNSNFMVNYTNYLLDTKLADFVLWAWVEFLNEDYIAHFCLVNPLKSNLLHNIETVKKIF